VRGGQFHAGLGSEILELQQLAAAQTEYLLSVSAQPQAPVGRERSCIRALSIKGLLFAG
jgi:hypothetical protein